MSNEEIGKNSNENVADSENQNDSDVTSNNSENSTEEKDGKTEDGVNSENDSKQDSETEDDSSSDENGSDAESDDNDADEKTEEELEKLTKEDVLELIKKASERDEYFDKMQRTQAEYLNFQKRKNKESQDLRRFAIQNMVIEFTSVLDNFERALVSSKEARDFDKLFEGIKLVENQFIKILENSGVKPIETVGKPFDPVMHEAVMEEENNEHPHHTVVLELQKGFLLHDRVVRPAKVKVSKRSESENEESENGETENDNGEEDKE